MKMRRWLPAVPIIAGLTLAACAAAAPGDGATSPETAGPDFLVQGEYRGSVQNAGPWGAQVIALGSGVFRAVLLGGGLPGDGWDGTTRVVMDGHTEGGQARLKGEGWEGVISGGRLLGKGPDGKALKFSRTVRKSPTLGAAPPAGAHVLFNGRDAGAWENGKVTEDGLLQVGTKSKESFEDFRLHLEFRTPFMPAARGQGRGNSGMYLQDRYEVQILDSFGLEGLDNECGGIYRQSRPRVNMCFPPLSWQTYDVEFHAARFTAGGRKTSPATLTLRHNGVVIHDHLHLSEVTPGGGKNREDFTPGPIQIQNHGNPVHVRNVWAQPLGRL